MLENPNEPVNDNSYFDCLESVMDNSKLLGESMSGITQHARASELESFGEAVTATQKSLIGLTEAAAQVRFFGKFILANKHLIFTFVGCLFGWYC